MRAILGASLAVLLLNLPPGVAGDKKSEVEELRAKLLQLDKAHKAELAKRDEQIKDLQAAVTKLGDDKLKTREADLNVERAKVEAERWKEEAGQLLIALKKREAMLVKLQAELADHLKEMRAIKSDAKTIMDRNVELLLLVKRLEQRKELPPMATPAPDGKPNPPPGKVKGVINRIHPKDVTIVHLSVGTNQGVKAEHTLEVYRSRPQPQYLGMIRIIESLPESSVGQRMASSLNLGEFLVGDHVVGKIELPK